MILPACVTAVLLGLLTATAPTDAGPVPTPPVHPGALPAPPSRCAAPAQVLDLTNWKITLPVPKPNGAKGPLEILQPGLAGYVQPPWFLPSPSCDAVVFRAPVTGVTTSGSKYPRSELREMVDGGSGTASWSSAGQHRITVTEAFTHLPLTKPQLVGVQIHDAADDITVLRLEDRKLWITRGDDPHYRLITDAYQLGTRFEVSFAVDGGTIRVSYDGIERATIPTRVHGAYFKVGAYTQANCGNAPPCRPDNYGETTVYRVTVSHHVTDAEVLWDRLLRWAPVLSRLLGLLLVGVVVRALYRRGDGIPARAGAPSPAGAPEHTSR